MELQQLPNLGPKTILWLQQIGLKTEADLREIGAVEAYLRLKAAFPEKVSLNALYGLEAALLGIDWREIPEARKAELRQLVGR